MSEKRYTVEMAIYKRREGSSNIGVNYIRDNYSKNNKMVKCCGRNYVDVEVPESAIVFGDTNRHIINKVCERLNDLNNENEQLKETINEVKTDEKQLSISFMDYKMQLIEVLQQNYNYAYSQRQKNLDKSIVAKTYEVLAQTVYHIAETMNVDIERFPKDGDVE